MFRHIPNLLTLGNLVTGCAGIICSFRHPDLAPVWFIGISCSFDFLDGFSARLLKVSSPMGKELDSLADVVSFGVYPAVIIFHALDKTGAGATIWFALVLAAFSALRLAMFNTDQRQTDAFIGLPTPAMALFVAGSGEVLNWFPMEWHQTLLLIITAGLSLLMVAPIPLVALKFKTFAWKGNQVRYAVMACSATAVVMLGTAGLPVAITLYLLTAFAASQKP